MLNLSRNPQVKDVEQGDAVIKGPEDRWLSAGLAQNHRHEVLAGHCFTVPGLFATISLVIASLLFFISSLPLAAYGLLVPGFMFGAMAAYSMRKSLLHNVAQLQALSFYSGYSTRGLRHVLHHRLLVKLGMSTTYFKGELVTTAFYIARNETDQTMAVVAYAHLHNNDSYIGMVLPIDKFVKTAFMGEKFEWEYHANEIRRFTPQINSYIKDTFTRNMGPEIYSALKPLFQTDNAFLRMALKNDPELLEQLDDVTNLQLMVWCELYLPRKLVKRNLLVKIPASRRFKSQLRALLSSLNSLRSIAAPVPSPMMVEMVDFCTSKEGLKYIDDFAFWLWNITPGADSAPPRSSKENAWMLQALSSQDADVLRSYLLAVGPGLNNPTLYAFKRIIEFVGVDPKAMDSPACHIGYRKLFGFDAALKAFPLAGRSLLSDDLGI